jgi:hypothetical protein
MERAEWRLIARGEGIHWPKLDEDISVASLLEGRRSVRRRSLFAGGSASGNRLAKEILAVESTQTVPLSAR